MQLETQEFRAEAKFQRVSPQKARLVLELIKGRRVGEALETVGLAHRASAYPASADRVATAHRSPHCRRTKPSTTGAPARRATTRWSFHFTITSADADGKHADPRSIQPAFGPRPTGG